ncbi:hypothetical protein C362_01399 [Cryptococcus neoformans Bt1]|nr:hypothetical protein C362_01399 [Cryptococcus neoformans var. grubii Bt1]OXG14229.1 hypothetical protein C367_05912 [Cryptococcus neoformans var. grubii Ze90-1]
MIPEDHQQLPSLPSSLSPELKPLIPLSPEPQSVSPPLRTVTPSQSQQPIKTIATHKKNASINQGSRFPSRTPQNDRQCTNCGETDTPQWRGTLCNACALWKRSRGTDRPLPLLFPVRKRSLSCGDDEEGERERSPAEILESWKLRNHVIGYGRTLSIQPHPVTINGRPTPGYALPRPTAFYPSMADGQTAQLSSSTEQGLPSKIVSMTQAHSYARGRQLGRNIEGGRREAEETEVRFPKFTRSPYSFQEEPRTINLERRYSTLRYNRYALSRQEFMRGAEWLYDVLQQTSKLLGDMDNDEERAP